MELAAATEDAQQSRQELRAARAELARSKAQQATVRFCSVVPAFDNLPLIPEKESPWATRNR